MNILPWVVALALPCSTVAMAADDPPFSGAAREGVAVGAVASPALEGGGFWFMPAVRASVPLGAKYGLDLEAGRILGASHRYATVRSFLAGQLRFRREPAEDLVDRYWLVGLRHLRMTKLDGHGSVLRYDPDTALSIGHGWRHTFGNGARALTEVGFSGGEGYMAYVTFGVQWRFLPRDGGPRLTGRHVPRSRPPGPSWPRGGGSAPSGG
jgi:hypothetical protein